MRSVLLVLTVVPCGHGMGTPWARHHPSIGHRRGSSGACCSLASCLPGFSLIAKPHQMKRTTGRKSRPAPAMTTPSVKISGCASVHSQGALSYMIATNHDTRRSSPTVQNMIESTMVREICEEMCRNYRGRPQRTRARSSLRRSGPNRCERAPDRTGGIQPLGERLSSRSTGPLPDSPRAERFRLGPLGVRPPPRPGESWTALHGPRGRSGVRQGSDLGESRFRFTF